MFDSITSLFSPPLVSNRNYEKKPSLADYCKSKKAVVRHGRKQEFIDKQIDDIIYSLSQPVETWIIQKQPHIKSFTLNKTIISIILLNSRNSKAQNTENGVSITVHNLFVLIIQYKLLNEYIKEINTSQLELFLDGICGIYLKQENGPLDQLTCLLHFIVSNCKMHNEGQNIKKNLTFCRPIQFANNRVQNFIQVYSDLPEKFKGRFIDSVVNIIPMMVELFKIIIKTDSSPTKTYIIEKIPWMHEIGKQILTIICKNIDGILKNNEQQGSYSTSQSDQNPNLYKRLHEKSIQLNQIEGFVSSKVLFNYAYKELYYYQHVLRLHRYLMDITIDHHALMTQQQEHNLQLVKLLLQTAVNYDMNLPDTAITALGGILKSSLFTGHNADHLYLPQMTPSMQQFIQDMKSSQYYQINSCLGQDEESQQQFYLQPSDNIIYYIIKMIFNLKLEYLELLGIIMKNTNKTFMENLQFYLIKNGFLHFLIQELYSIHSNDKKSLENYFQVLSMLLHRNSVAYCLLNQIIELQLRQNQKCTLIQYIKKNFIHSKQFLLITLADSISINSKKVTSHFIPLTIKHLLYPGTSKNTRHDVWISYIHDVIIRQLSTKMERQKNKDQLNQQISQWVMLAIMLQIQYMQFKKGSDVELGQFTMGYLTNILSEAIKWKHEDETSVMRRLLKNYQNWEVYYTETILNIQDNQDIINTQLGPTINFLFLRKWNRKICNSIKMFILSVIQN